MGAVNTKADCVAYAAGIEATIKTACPDRKEAVPWYADVNTDSNGCRVFPTLPPPGQHPRLLFTKEEVPHLLAMHTHTHLKGVLDSNARAKVRKFRECYTAFSEVSDEERINPSKETLLKFFVKDADRNQSWFLSYIYAFNNDDSDLLNMVKEHVLFYAMIIVKSAEMAREQGFTDGEFAIWTTRSEFWDMQTTYLMGGCNFAILYDLLHSDLSEEKQSLMRKAISTAITGRKAWGMGWSPRRIQSNWAPYHGGLLCMASAIEGEEGEDTEVVKQFSELMNNFLDYSVYDSGHPIEDCYFLNLALREGSVAFMVMARRGYNMFAKPNYINVMKKWVPFALDPHPDGGMYGGSSGSDCVYPGGIITAKYMYPKDRVVDFVYRHYARGQGKEYHLLSKTQTHFMTALFAIPALNETLTVTCPNEDVHSAVECDLPKTFTCFNRGKVIMRSDWTQNALCFTLDSRPDGFLIGHDAPTRGAFVMHAHGRSWAACPEWGIHKESSYYSLMTIDGKGFLPKAPFVKLLSSVEGAKESTYAASDLTYSANYEWTQWAKFENNAKLEADGWEPEPNNPRDFGMNTWWLPNRVYGEPDVSFAGLNTWRRKFNDVAQVTRSAMIVRDVDAPFVLIADDAVKGDDAQHEYKWNMTMAPDVKLISFDGKDAIVGEEGDGGRRLLVRLLDGSDAGEVDCTMETSTVINPKHLKLPNPVKAIFQRLVFKTSANEAHFRICLFPLATAEQPLLTTVWAKGSVGDAKRTLAVDGQVLIDFECLPGGSKETVLKVAN